MNEWKKIRAIYKKERVYIPMQTFLFFSMFFLKKTLYTTICTRIHILYEVNYNYIIVPVFLYRMIFEYIGISDDVKLSKKF